ncbi:hypothetical protein B296_00029405 [Ensete ventricosum]|uniref:Uncharacterized protein n=1 Tax=Ensete ventricosum TaxID=4639 RepID=A0A426XGH7_ENSVE|nr:hypothetical protein B296_00029405 [Ensete ventricosum]
MIGGRENRAHRMPLWLTSHTHCSKGTRSGVPESGLASTVAPHAKSVASPQCCETPRQDTIVTTWGDTKSGARSFSSHTICWERVIPSPRCDSWRVHRSNASWPKGWRRALHAKASGDGYDMNYVEHIAGITVRHLQRGRHGCVCAALLLLWMDLGGRGMNPSNVAYMRKGLCIRMRPLDISGWDRSKFDGICCLLQLRLQEPYPQRIKRRG